ncbi:hypothetical protein [Phyllobacterium sp. K27]
MKQLIMSFDAGNFSLQNVCTPWNLLIFHQKSGRLSLLDLQSMLKDPALTGGVKSFDVFIGVATLLFQNLK